MIMIMLQYHYTMTTSHAFYMQLGSTFHSHAIIAVFFVYHNFRKVHMLEGFTKEILSDDDNDVEWRYVHGNELPDRFSWNLIPCSVSQTPSQENDRDCGVFVCMFIDLLSQGYNIHGMQQSDLLYSREKIAASLLANKIVR